MRVFISWSGELSKKLGEAIRDWLPAVIQNISPYFTPSDIEKGSRWLNEITKELDNSDIGLLCITRENIHSEWLLFEAGAISKKMGESSVCPILFNLENKDLKGPLSQFQSTIFDKLEMKKLIKMINGKVTKNKLDENVLEVVFEKWWPDLECKIKNIFDHLKKDIKEPIRTDRDVLDEVLSLARFIAKSKKLNMNDKVDSPLLSRRFLDLFTEFIEGFIIVFDDDWNYTREILKDPEIFDYYISPEGSFLSPQIDDEYNNWKNRGALLESFRKMKDFFKEHRVELPRDILDTFYL